MKANDTFPDDHKIRLDFTLTLDIIVSTFCLLPKICDGRKDYKKCRSRESLLCLWLEINCFVLAGGHGGIWCGSLYRA